MRLAIDTNRYIDFARGVPGVEETLIRAAQVFLPFIVLGELRAGWYLGSRPELNERALSQFLNRPGVELLFADVATTKIYADLYAEQRRRNALIPTNVLWIAALALQHDLVIYTRDSHFEVISRVPRI